MELRERRRRSTDNRQEKREGKTERQKCRCSKYHKIGALDSQAMGSHQFSNLSRGHEETPIV